MMTIVGYQDDDDSMAARNVLVKEFNPEILMKLIPWSLV